MISSLIILILIYITLIFAEKSNLNKEKFAGWIDPDTSPSFFQTKSFASGEEYDLVMSDEFNRPGRTFKDGHDPMWTAIDKSDDDQTSSGRGSLQFYNSSTISTDKGLLIIETNTEDTDWKGWNPYKKRYEKMSRHFKSGMLQSWNKFCFTGGILEVSVQLPGRHDVGGLWPAAWMLGNLGRATFEASTNLMWPWSYQKCDRSLQKAQKLSGCDVTSHFSLHPGQGRGATEIDIIEVMPGPSTKLPFVKHNVRRPYTSMTLQIAPGIPASKKRPQSGTLPEWGFTWYDNLTYGKNVSINPFFYGTYLSATSVNEPVARSKEESYQCDAISSIMSINESYFNSLHKFRIEWQPGENGYLKWYVDDDFKFGVDAKSLKPMDTQIPNEPSYVILNTAISTSWGFPNPPFGCTLYDCKDPEGQCGMNSGFCKSLPAHFYVDYVRVYQNKQDPSHTLGCNPPDFPTKRYIKGHEFKYKVLTDVYALRPILTGGAACESNDECGEGVCSFFKCVCNINWQGPRCLVPTYKNDFEDWEQEGWIILSLPHIPLFLIIVAISTFLALFIASIYISINKQKYQLKPSWL